LARARLGPPQLLSLRYGRFRPQGTPHPYLALKLRVRARGGQVVETELSDRRSQFDAIADSQCGLHGQENGGVETSYTPTMKKFVKGAQDVHVTVLASSCNRKNESRQASRTFKLVVRYGPDRRERSDRTHRPGCSSSINRGGGGRRGPASRDAETGGEGVR
jgi:hypothetical protein